MDAMDTPEWQEGYSEGLEGMNENNPYEPGSEEGMNWSDGYQLGLEDGGWD